MKLDLLGDPLDVDPELSDLLRDRLNLAVSALTSRNSQRIADQLVLISLALGALEDEVSAGNLASQLAKSSQLRARLLFARNLAERHLASRSLSPLTASQPWSWVHSLDTFASHVGRLRRASSRANTIRSLQRGLASANARARTASAFRVFLFGITLARLLVIPNEPARLLDQCCPNGPPHVAASTA